MALTEQEKEIILKLKNEGRSAKQIAGHLGGLRLNRQSSVSMEQQAEESPLVKSTIFDDLGSDIRGIGTGVASDFRQTTSDIGENIARGQSPISTGLQYAGGVGRTIGSLAARTLQGVGKVLLPQKAEDRVAQATQEFGETVSDPENKALGSVAIRSIMGQMDKIEKENPELAGNIKAGLGIVEGAGTAIGVTSALKTVSPIIRQIREQGKDLFKGAPVVVTSVDDLIKKTDTALTRELAESEAPELTLSEKFVGIQPDIKKRIAGKQDQLREYFDVAHARNVDDTLPTPYEFGATKVQNAVNQMEDLLSETGGKIGTTRQRLGTVQATPDAVGTIESSFAQQLDRLNLEIKGGHVVQKQGTILRVGSNNDINVLDGLYQELRVMKQNPSLTNIIDLRSQFDARINFAKRASEASNTIDPVSRQVRKTIADEAAKIVGKSEAAELKKFSEFMDAYTDLQSYASRRAGGEYLLRLVLSGRGGEARQIVNTIKEFTGIDLMDDATMMTIATDLIGNSRQKNLFRQEITKSGLDAARVLSGDTSGAISLMSDYIKKNFFDEEQIFLEAAK